MRAMMRVESWVLFDDGWTFEAVKMMDAVVQQSLEDSECSYTQLQKDVAASVLMRIATLQSEMYVEAKKMHFFYMVKCRAYRMSAFSVDIKVILDYWI